MNVLLLAFGAVLPFLQELLEGGRDVLVPTDGRLGTRIVGDKVDKDLKLADVVGKDVSDERGVFVVPFGSNLELLA